MGIEGIFNIAISNISSSSATISNGNKYIEDDEGLGDIDIASGYNEDAEDNEGFGDIGVASSYNEDAEDDEGLGDISISIGASTSTGYYSP